MLAKKNFYPGSYAKGFTFPEISPAVISYPYVQVQKEKAPTGPEPHERIRKTYNDGKKRGYYGVDASTPANFEQKKCPIDWCIAEFICTAARAMHMKKKHGWADKQIKEMKPIILQCNVNGCERRYLSQVARLRHIRNVHSNKVVRHYNDNFRQGLDYSI